MKRFPPRTDAPAHCAVVTGAAGGIGLCFCRELARRGCDLVMVDRDAEALSRSQSLLQKEWPENRVLALALDLTDSLANEKLETFCTLNAADPDILVNNAGIFSFRPIADTSVHTIDTFTDLHVRAVTLLSHWFVERRLAAGSGWLLNMSSMSCWMPVPGLALYAATKAYIRVFSRSLAHEVADRGLSVTVACPGGIATSLFGLPPNLMKLAVGIGALSRPEKFARRAVDRMISRRHQYVNGLLNRLSILGVGMTPGPLRRLVKTRLLDKGITR